MTALNSKLATSDAATTFALKANTSDTYTKTQVANLFHPKINSFVSPLRCDLNILSGINALSIDENASLAIGDITSSGALHIDTIAPNLALELTLDGDCAVSGVLLVDTMTSSVSDHIQVNDNFSVSGNVAVGGNLVVAGYISAKPFVSLRVLTSTATPATPSTATVIGTPGATTVVQYGYIQNVAIARGTVGAANAFLYTFTWTTPHPLGLNYIVNAGFRTGSTSDVMPTGVITTNITSSTSFNLWIRTTVGSTPNIFADGNFYIYTVP
jgi:hypothetical protein